MSQPNQAPQSSRPSRQQRLLDDLIAGATGAVAGIPQSMGYAIIAGINPVYGLHTAIVSTIIAALTCHTSRMTVAPTNALALVVGSTLSGFEEASQIERLFMLTLLVGVFQLGFGLLGLGTLTRFVSNAVMTGFLMGAALLIILGQLPNLTGYHSAFSKKALPKFWTWLRHIDQSDTRTVIVGCTAIALIVIINRTRFRNMATLVAIVLTSIFVAAAGWDSVAVVRDTSPIPSRLPQIEIPDLRYAGDLALAALAIAVLGSVQSAGLAIAMPAASPEGLPNINRDLISQGLANIGGGVLQSMPAGGTLSRTAVNLNAGARTRLSNVFAGLLIAVVLLSISPAIEQIVMVGLAAQLITAALRVIDLRRAKMIWQVNSSGRFLMLVTFFSTLVLPLQYSIYIGVSLSLVLYAYTSAMQIKVVRLVPETGHQFHEKPVPEHLPDGEPVILSVSGHLYFAATNRLRELLPSPNNTQRPVVILRLRDHAYLGSSGIHLLEWYAQQLEAHQGKLILAGVNPTIENELRRAGTLERLGHETLFRANTVIFDATQQALAYGHEWLAETD
ncbi:MAG: SulP family inorganic anion transporter [Anaerolineae bacterium]|nr:SulP family inorganic anion transporter [Anaerolineae bacterium]